jgi:hypothetical protein
MGHSDAVNDTVILRSERAMPRIGERMDVMYLPDFWHHNEKEFRLYDTTMKI